MQTVYHVTVARKNGVEKDFVIGGDSFHSVLTRVRSMFGFNAKRIDENATKSKEREYRLHHAVREYNNKNELKYKTYRFSGSIVNVKAFDLPDGQLFFPLTAMDVDLPEVDDWRDFD